jgi:hypothetical protein
MLHQKRRRRVGRAKGILHDGPPLLQSGAHERVAPQREPCRDVISGVELRVTLLPFGMAAAAQLADGVDHLDAEVHAPHLGREEELVEMAADGEASAGGVPIGRCASAHGEDSAGGVRLDRMQRGTIDVRHRIHACIRRRTVECFRHSQKQSVFQD